MASDMQTMRVMHREDITWIRKGPSTGRPGYNRVDYVLIDKDHSCSLGKLLVSTNEDALSTAILPKVEANLRRISDHLVYSRAAQNAGFTYLTNFQLDAMNHRATLRIFPNIDHMNGPKSESYDVATAFLERARIHQFLRDNKQGQDHIEQFQGCVEKDGRMVALVVERHDVHLTYFLNAYGTDGFGDCEDVYEQIKTAVEHLHSLGLAHNAILSENVRLARVDWAVLVNFGSCKVLGQELKTMQSYRGFKPVSCKENDLNGLKALKAWLNSFQ